MLCIRRSEIDSWGDSKGNVAVLNGSDLKGVGYTEGRVNRYKARYEDTDYEVRDTGGDSVWCVLEPVFKEHGFEG